MFSDGEGLTSPIKFAVATTYDKFQAKWGLPSERLGWVDVWSRALDRFTVEEINAVSAYCVEGFRRAPALFEFVELATRLQSGRPLSDPIVSRVERIAYLILASDEFRESRVSMSELSDACLIAGAIAYIKSYDEAQVALDDSEFRIAEFSGRARMFAREALDWRVDASEGKGYWKDTFEPPPKMPRDD